MFAQLTDKSGMSVEAILTDVKLTLVVSIQRQWSTRISISVGVFKTVFKSLCCTAGARHLMVDILGHVVLVPGCVLESSSSNHVTYTHYARDFPIDGFSACRDMEIWAALDVSANKTFGRQISPVPNYWPRDKIAGL